MREDVEAGALSHAAVVFLFSAALVAIFAFALVREAVSAHDQANRADAWRELAARLVADPSDKTRAEVAAFIKAETGN